MKQVGQGLRFIDCIRSFNFEVYTLRLDLISSWMVEVTDNSKCIGGDEWLSTGQGPHPIVPNQGEIGVNTCF